MERHGPGDYLAAAPTYKLLDKGIYVEIRRVFQDFLKLGKVVGGASGEFRFSPGGFRRLWPGHTYRDCRIVFGYAENPDSLEAMTARGAWLDEAGQKNFKQASFEAIQRRVSIDQGKILITTTPYTNNHWTKTLIYDAWKRRGTPQETDFDKDIAVISFETIMNPSFPMREWLRAKSMLPEWRFDLFYRGLFTRPAGAIYDCWDSAKMVIKSWPNDPPKDWKRLCGMDFGAPNFAAVFLAQDPETMMLHLYKEYRPGEKRTAKEHCDAMLKLLNLQSWSDGNFLRITGGAKSEGQWRAEMKAAGMDVAAPDQPEVEVGIDRVYGQIKTDKLRIWDRCKHIIKDIENYSRPIDDAGNPLEGIEDKETFHSADALRYIMSWYNKKNMLYMKKV